MIINIIIIMIGLTYTNACHQCKTATRGFTIISNRHGCKARAFKGRDIQWGRKLQERRVFGWEIWYHTYNAGLSVTKCQTNEGFFTKYEWKCVKIHHSRGKMSFFDQKLYKLRILGWQSMLCRGVLGCRVSSKGGLKSLLYRSNRNGNGIVNGI